MAMFRSTAARQCWAFCGSAAFRLTLHPSSSSLSAYSLSCRPRMTASVFEQSPSWRGVHKFFGQTHSRNVLLFKKPPKENGGNGGTGKGGSGWGGSSGQGGGGSGGGGGDDRNAFQRMVSAYIDAQESRPILTKSSSTLVLVMLGDYCAQRLAAAQTGRVFELDLRRWLSVGTYGFCFMAPVLHHWYGLLDRVFGTSAAVRKMITDQLLFSIPFNSAFILGVGTLEGGKPKEVLRSLREKWWTTAKANWTLWPAAQWVNFAIVPKEFQMIYVNCVGFVWNVVLTYIAHARSKPVVACAE